MGRRRRRVIRVVRRSLPHVFPCPKCGTTSVRVTAKSSDLYLVACGSCDLRSEYPSSPNVEPIDIYNKFVDSFTSGNA